jgi:hypothetical protein
VDQQEFYYPQNLDFESQGTTGALGSLAKPFAVGN